MWARFFSAPNLDTDPDISWWGFKEPSTYCDLDGDGYFYFNYTEEELTPGGVGCVTDVDFTVCRPEYADNWASNGCPGFGWDFDPIDPNCPSKYCATCLVDGVCGGVCENPPFCANNESESTCWADCGW